MGLAPPRQEHRLHICGWYRVQCLTCHLHLARVCVLSKGGVLTWLDDRGTETYRNSHSRADEGRTRDLRLERAVLSE